MQNIIIIIFITSVSLFLIYIKNTKNQIRILKAENKRLKSLYEQKLHNQLDDDPTAIAPLSENTESIILSKLDVFEINKGFTDKNLSLKILAKSLNTNSKYLSYVVNKHKGNNFSNYITVLRVNYIVKKFEQEPKYLEFNASELAEKAGFISRTAFVTKFKDVTGKSPSQFKIEKK